MEEQRRRSGLVPELGGADRPDFAGEPAGELSRRESREGRPGQEPDPGAEQPRRQGRTDQGGVVPVAARAPADEVGRDERGSDEAAVVLG
jgi:hypothetical protein